MNSSALTTSSILLALVVLLSAPTVVTGLLDEDSNSTEIPTETCQSITDILCTEGNNLKALCEAVAISDLSDDLAEDAWTIFAPTDDAFEALGRDNLDSLVFGNDTVPLTDLLLFHIVPGVSLTSDLLPCEAGNNLLEMANGKDSRTLCTGKTSPIEQRGQFNDKADAPAFIDTDIVACNGVIHILDKVMLYEALPYDIPEGEPTPAIVATPDATPESTRAPDSTPDYIRSGDSKSKEQECQTIAELACSNSDFSIVCTLLTENDLIDDLNEGLWTIFVPTNAAFDQAPRIPSDVDIGFVLEGHVVADAKIAFEDLACTEKTEMANGRNTRTVCTDKHVFQKGAGNAEDQRPQIVERNIEACNGLVHVINEVILP